MSTGYSDDARDQFSKMIDPLQAIFAQLVDINQKESDVEERLQESCRNTANDVRNAIRNIENILGVFPE